VNIKYDIDLPDLCYHEAIGTAQQIFSSRKLIEFQKPTVNLLGKT